MIWITFLLGSLFVSLIWNVRQNRIISSLKLKNKEMSTDSAIMRQSMDELRHTILHDLSAPLRAIHGFCEILQNKKKILNHSETNEFLSLIHDNSVLMKSMIEDVREYFRVSNSSLHLESVDLTTLIEACYKQCIQSRESDSIQFNIQPLASVQGDRGLLNIMMTHILTNAIKFSNKYTTAVIDVRQEGESVVIQDNGVGFDMAYKDKIFKLFQRLHSKEQFKGNGVGLAIVNRIIQKHNGSISVESVLGQGTQVSFQIPKLMKNA